MRVEGAATSAHAFNRLRDIALSRALGLSLGKTHYLVRALLEKGVLKVSNFRRSNNKIAYRYLLTPAGMRKRLDLTRAFLARKESEFLALQHTIRQLRSELPVADDSHVLRRADKKN